MYVIQQANIRMVVTPLETNKHSFFFTSFYELLVVLWRTLDQLSDKYFELSMDTYISSMKFICRFYFGNSITLALIIDIYAK